MIRNNHPFKQSAHHAIYFNSIGVIQTLETLIQNQQMRPGKSTHIFQVGDHSLVFSGNFDSGNLRNVHQLGPFEYEIQPALDSYDLPSSSKAFFHFSISDFPKGQTLSLLFRDLALLYSIIEDCKKYLPFTSNDGLNYRRMQPSEIEVINKDSHINLRIKTIINNPVVFFSFALPYSYERYLNMVRDLPPSNSQIFISKQVLCYSNNLNLVYMITITSPSRFLETDEKIGQNTNSVLLPERRMYPPRKYCDKPVILMSCRVHPGESASSWAVEGIINFLIGDSDDAKLIRKHFQVVIIPMLNPDGVYEGLYRLDTRGHNLNRYYLISDNRQPSIYCMKHLIKHFQETKRLLYYFDFHGHPSQKGAFLYGNAIPDLPFQVQTELFARLMSRLCPTFQQKFCIFDRSQMSSKDKYDLYTKEGCARVFAFRLSSIVHSYTVQLGFHGLSSRQSQFIYNQQNYYQQGISILQAILISCGMKQPSILKLHDLRKALAIQICARDERFRKQQRHLQRKKQNVNEIIEQQYWKSIHELYFPYLTKTKNKFFTKKKNQTLQKKQQNYNNFQSFCSEVTLIQNLNPPIFDPQQKQQKTSLQDILEQAKIKKPAHFITVKLNRTINSYKSTNASLQNDSQQKVKSKKMLRFHHKLTNPVKLQSSGGTTMIKQKFRSLKKPGALRSIEQRFGREQEYQFSDINIRDLRQTDIAGLYRGSNQKSLQCKNKIHSLFIETHH